MPNMSGARTDPPAAAAAATVDTARLKVAGSLIGSFACRLLTQLTAPYFFMRSCSARACCLLARRRAVGGCRERGASQPQVLRAVASNAIRCRIENDRAV